MGQKLCFFIRIHHQFLSGATYNVRNIGWFIRRGIKVQEKVPETLKLMYEYVCGGWCENCITVIVEVVVVVGGRYQINFQSHILALELTLNLEEPTDCLTNVAED